MLIKVTRIDGLRIFGIPVNREHGKRSMLVHALDLRGGTVVESLLPGDVLDVGTVEECERGFRGYDVYFSSRPDRVVVKVTVIKPHFAFGKTESGQPVFLSSFAFADGGRDKRSMVFQQLFVGQMLECLVDHTDTGKNPAGYHITPA